MDLEALKNCEFQFRVVWVMLHDVFDIFKSVGIVPSEGTIFVWIVHLDCRSKVLYELWHTECDEMYEFCLLSVWIVKPDDCMNCD